MSVCCAIGSEHWNAKLFQMFEEATFGEVERHCLLAMAQSPESAVHKAAYEYGVEQVHKLCTTCVFTPMIAGQCALSGSDDSVYGDDRDQEGPGLCLALLQG